MIPQPTSGHTQCGSRKRKQRKLPAKTTLAFERTAKRGLKFGSNGGRSFAESPDAIAKNTRPLRVTQACAAVPTEIAFQEIARADIAIHDAVYEIGVGVGREGGIKKLVAAVHLHAKRVAEAFGEGKRFILPAPKRAVEFRVVQVHEHPGLPQLAKRETVGLVEGVLLVRRRFALPQACEQTNVLGESKPDIAAETLKEELIQQTGPQQARIECRQCFKVVVVCTKSDQLRELKVQRRKAL